MEVRAVLMSLKRLIDRAGFSAGSGLALAVVIRRRKLEKMCFSIRE